MSEFSTLSSTKLIEGTLYPGIGYGENQLRWGFIRKVYGILTAQWILTTAVSSATVRYAPLNDLLRGNYDLLFLPVILLLPLYIYRKKHPINLVLLGLFSSTISVSVGVSCANTDGKIVLEASVLTSAVVSALTGYTFWASKKEKDFSYIGLILFTNLFVLFLTGFLQAFYPLGSTTSAVYGALGAIVFSGYIIYDTTNLIQIFTCDEYIWASVTLYLDFATFYFDFPKLFRTILHNCKLKLCTKKILSIICYSSSISV